MINGKKILAIIPARGGSKSLKNKNISLLNGKPLIYYTINIAKQITFFDEIIVSTDDKTIANIAESYDVKIPFIRDAKFSRDDTPSAEVVQNCLDWYEKKNINFDYCILLQPTSPLRTIDNITDAFQHLMQNSTFKSLVSVCEVYHHPYWMTTIPETVSAFKFSKSDYLKLPRQALPKMFRLNGSIYLSEINYFKEHQSFFGPLTIPFIMGRFNSIDINDMLDLRYAEFLLQKGYI